MMMMVSTASAASHRCCGDSEGFVLKLHHGLADHLRGGQGVVHAALLCPHLVTDNVDIIDIVDSVDIWIPPSSSAGCETSP